jgi:Flp pilus assembly pilin Flp
MRFLRDENGTDMVEWLIVTAILVAVLGGVFLTLFGTLGDKLEAINDGL